MSTHRSRIQKGRSFQRKIKEMIQSAFDLSDDDIRTAIGAENGCDIKLSKVARDKVGLSIECKNQQKISLWSALEQAKANVEPNTEPALIFHRSKPGNREVWITVPLEHYLELKRGNIHE